MNGDIAALLMGAAAVLIFAGFQIRRKAARKREKEMLLAEFIPKEEHTDE